MESLSEWMYAGLIIRVSERHSLLGIKDKSKLCIFLTMVNYKEDCLKVTTLRLNSPKALWKMTH